MRGLPLVALDLGLFGCRSLMRGQLGSSLVHGDLFICDRRRLLFKMSGIS
jgi:hypothetical protein